jgi:hypothetical protein
MKKTRDRLKEDEKGRGESRGGRREHHIGKRARTGKAALSDEFHQRNGDRERERERERKKTSQEPQEEEGEYGSNKKRLGHAPRKEIVDEYVHILIRKRGSEKGEERFGGGDDDLLNEISGDRGRGSGVATHHALVHLHQVLLLHSKPI